MKAINLRSPGFGDKDTVLECYEFNTFLAEDLDDGDCIHCRKYLTLECEHINEFIDDAEEDDE